MRGNNNDKIEMKEGEKKVIEKKTVGLCWLFSCLAFSAKQ